MVNEGRRECKEERVSSSLVLLGAIMAVMKAHLSPSQHNRITHNEIAVALE